MKVCDMCGSDIIENKCSCGIWTSAEENENEPMKLGLEKFHSMNEFCFSGDAPHLGCAVVYFRGDINDCEAVKKFLCVRKQRPFYT
jgi:hypothetical protein